MWQRELRFVSEQQFGGDLLLDARGKVARGLQIERHHDRATQQATVESNNPLGTILTPEDHAIAGADPARLKLARKLKCTRSKTRVRPARDSQPAPVNDSGLLAAGDAVVEKAEQRLAHEQILPQSTRERSSRWDSYGGCE